MRFGYFSYGAPPAIGGGSIYMRYLFEEMERQSAVERFVILTEALDPDVEEPLPDGEKSRVRRVLVRRASLRDRHPVGGLLRLAIQQLQFARIVQVARREHLDALIFHSGTLLHAPLLRPLLGWLRRSNIACVLDIRDLSSKASQQSLIDRFDGIIVCGEGPAQHVAQTFGGRFETTSIPVPFRPSDVGDESMSAGARKLKELGLGEEDSFVLMSGGLTPTKLPTDAIDTIARLWVDHQVPVVACGNRRPTTDSVDLLLGTGAIRYAGPIDHETYMGIMARSSCVASFSASEGLPRTMLESFALGKPTFVPSFVPEFEGLRCLDGDAESQVRQLAATLERPAGGPGNDYEISAHDPERVAANIVEFLAGLSCDVSKHA